jgi:two-component system, LytTR family, response regulator
MTSISCFIVDDEPLALSLVESYVNKTPFLQLTGKFSSALACSSAMHETPPDVIFLDIQMAELSGMEFAKVVPEKTRIIFTTAFQQYAIEGYKVNALDYLLKPFSYAEFLQAATKAMEWVSLNRKADTPAIEEKATDASIFVKADYRLVKIEIAGILYIEGLKDYLKIYMEAQPQPIITHITMKVMEEMLPAAQFLRVHRSFIVQKSKIRIVEHNRIVFGKTYIPVSDSYKETFDQFIREKMK